MAADSRHSAQNATIPRRKIESALEEMAICRREYIRKSARGEELSLSLQRSLHAAVINCYSELRQYRSADPLDNMWSQAKMWPADDGSGWVRGIDTLSEWIDQKEPAKKRTPGRGSSHKFTLQPKLLPPKKALRATWALDRVAKELGIAIPVSAGKRPFGNISAESDPDL